MTQINNRNNDADNIHTKKPKCKTENNTNIQKAENSIQGVKSAFHVYCVRQPGQNTALYENPNHVINFTYLQS